VSVAYGTSGQWAEARAIAARIKARLDAAAGAVEGHAAAAPSDFAVLYRINAQSQPLEEALRAAGVPYRLRGSLAFFDRAEIRDAMSYARLLCNPRSDSDFERAIGAPHRGIGAASLDKLRARAAAAAAQGQGRGGCLMDAAEAEVARLSRAKRTKRHAALADFVELVRDLRQPPPFDVDDLDLDDLDLDDPDGAEEPQPQPQPQPAVERSAEQVLRACLERSGLLDALRDADARDKTDRLENVEALLALARRSEHAGLREFVDACAVSGSDVQHAAEAEVEAVALMTLHASKGLEFVDVTIAGCVEGWLPYQRSIQEGRLEEERRLCYVGITRARDRLVLSAPRSMTGFRGEVPTEPSRFIAEAGTFSLEAAAGGQSPPAAPRAKA
jgi:DNA helicase-2/ATP-dependent DNA helicase PcrA